MSEISKEQFEFWKELPETKIILSIVRERIAECQQFVADGGTCFSRDVDATAMETAKAIGEIQGLNFVLDIDYH